MLPRTHKPHHYHRLQKARRNSDGSVSTWKPGLEKDKQYSRMSFIHRQYYGLCKMVSHHHQFSMINDGANSPTNTAPLISDDDLSIGNNSNYIVSKDEAFIIDDEDINYLKHMKASRKSQNRADLKMMPGRRLFRWCKLQSPFNSCFKTSAVLEGSFVPINDEEGAGPGPGLAQHRDSAFSLVLTTNELIVKNLLSDQDENAVQESQEAQDLKHPDAVPHKIVPVRMVSTPVAIELEERGGFLAMASPGCDDSSSRPDLSDTLDSLTVGEYHLGATFAHPAQHVVTKTWTPTGRTTQCMDRRVQNIWRDVGGGNLNTDLSVLPSPIQVRTTKTREDWLSPPNASPFARSLVRRMTLPIYALANCGVGKLPDLLTPGIPEEVPFDEQDSDRQGRHGRGLHKQQGRVTHVDPNCLLLTAIPESPILTTVSEEEGDACSI